VIALQTGVLSLIIPVSLAVLLASGWRREIAGDAPLPAVTAVLVSGVFLTGVKLETGLLTVSADQIAYVLAAFAALGAAREPRHPLSPVIAAFPVAAAHHVPFILERLAGRLPVQPDLLASAAAGLFAAVLLSRPSSQFAALWLGLSAAELWRQQLTETVQVDLGGRGFADALWLSFLCARILSGLLGWAHGGASRLLARQK
jgi:hypothetical protein